MTIKALHARNDLGWAAGLGILGVASYFTLSGVLSQRLGVQGVVLAYILSWWMLLLLTLSSVLRLSATALFGSETRSFCTRGILSLTTCGVVGWGAKLLFRDVPAMEHLALVAGLASASYILVGARWLKMPELILVLTGVAAVMRTKAAVIASQAHDLREACGRL